MKNSKRVGMGHGSGGRLTHELVENLFVRVLKNRFLEPMGDSALLPSTTGRQAMSTDAFVVKPLFFPGGDIGRLSVMGSVNDLAVAGALPSYLSAAFILEEGYPLADLERIAQSMADAAIEAGVTVVTGDTKVVERGHGDGVYIVTTGVGPLRDSAPSGGVMAGDVVLVSGPIGDHGATIAAVRSQIESETLKSDCGSVSSVIDAMYAAGVRPRFMRDPTRGGLATVLAELAHDTGLSVEIEERHLPVRDSVRVVCEILGLDPLYLACEGRVVAVVPADQGELALQAMQSRPDGEDAALIGRLIPEASGPVVLVSLYGGRRLYDTLASEQLPRIC